MSAPDAATIIFGDIEYKRTAPEIDAALAGGTGLAETSLTSGQTFGPVPKASETK